MKKMTHEEAHEMVKAHELWLKTGGQEGAQADFSNKILFGMDFLYDNLDLAIFKDAKIDNCYFYCCSLNGADFSNSQARRLYLHPTSIEDADFSNACLIWSDYRADKIESAIFFNTTMAEGNKKNNWKGLQKNAHLIKPNQQVDILK